ncbi:metal-sensitive transcriptional regulator [Paenibacillaceae bacterium WGS1546]|uniref:metal-sensitive transcriptional regulator n=1 Tax=Cohnella sp. WGS1546 TaxID=3366810 RepID=UPI00372D62D2
MKNNESMISFPEHQKSSQPHPKAKHAIGLRLNRIEGQVRGLQRQVERDEYCDRILNQLEAVHSALNAVGIQLLSNHLESYVASASSRCKDSITQEMLITLSILIKRRDDEK